MTSSRVPDRWLARLALAAAAGSVVVPLAVAGGRSLWLLLAGAAGVAVTLAAGWWVVTRRGVVRTLAGVLALAAPVVVAALYVRAGLLWLVLLCGAFLAVAGAAARRALVPGLPTVPEYEVPSPRRPMLIMNPWSGGGKVGTFDLVARAERAGARVVLLDRTETAGGVETVAREGVALGADLLGVAGGDGTQARVATIAAEYGVPFLVIPAGTRNHFALDLGLDRHDPGTALDALTDGVELRVDLGHVGGRTFVNNASFGAYAAVVQRPAYRAEKARTTLDVLPEILAHHPGSRLRLRCGTTVIDDAQAVLVSNNPYRFNDLAGLGRRARLDGGVLGVLAVLVDSAGDAVSLMRGRRSRGLWFGTATEVVIEADTASIPVGIDGEAAILPAPVRCTIAPGALRVRVPRHRPGVPGALPVPLNWPHLARLAFSTGSPRSPGSADDGA